MTNDMYEIANSAISFTLRLTNLRGTISIWELLAKNYQPFTQDCDQLYKI